MACRLREDCVPNTHHERTDPVTIQKRPDIFFPACILRVCSTFLFFPSPHRIAFYRNGGSSMSSLTRFPRSFHGTPHAARQWASFSALSRGSFFSPFFFFVFSIHPISNFPIFIQPKVAVSSLPPLPFPHSPSAVSLEPRGRQKPEGNGVRRLDTLFPTVLSTVDH